MPAKLLGQEIREQRLRLGLSGPQLAQALGWSQSKVSRIETGNVTPSVSDIGRLAEALGVSAELRERWTKRALQALNSSERWSRLSGSNRLTRMQDLVADLEAASLRIDNLEVAILPGLLQNRAYAKAVLATSPIGEASSAAEAVDHRLRRRASFTDERRRFRFILTAGAVRNTFGGLNGLATDCLEHISAIDARPNVTIRVIPDGRSIPFPITCGFSVYDDRVAVVEDPAGQTGYRGAADVAKFAIAFERLWAASVPLASIVHELAFQ